MNDANAVGLEAMILQILPVMVIQCFYAIGAFVISRKRGVNPWPWTLVSLVPFVGLIAVPVFLYAMLGAIFDRLRALEGKRGEE
jgi:hypothetical protein